MREEPTAALNELCLFLRLNRKEKIMPTQEQETLNVKLVHFTKQNSPDDRIQLAFAVTDEQGKEEIITGEIPYATDLLRVSQEQGWMSTRRGAMREVRRAPVRAA